jgi:hypothetical protein
MQQNKYSNPSNVNVDKVAEGLVKYAGGTMKSVQKDGYVHNTVYVPPTDNTSQRRFSYDKYPDGSVDKVHSVKTSTSGEVTKTTYGKK